MSGEPQTAGHLRILWILHQVLRIYRAKWKVLVPIGLLVLLPQAATDALVGDAEIHRVHTLADFAKLIEIPLTLAINLGGEALYAGIIAALVVRWLDGRTLENAGAAIRAIPFGRLIAIDLILAFGTALGLVLLIVPGILLYTYLAVAPPLVEIKELRVGDAIRRSYGLVKGNFWRVLGYSLLVLVVSEAFTAALHSPLDGSAGTFLWNLGVEAAIEPFVGLTTVLLCLGLLDLHGEDRRLSDYAGRASGAV